MSKSAGPALQQLHDRYGQQVRFVSLYVREAHPGDVYPQPETLEEKLAHARSYAEREGIPWSVLVDDLDGTLHRALDPKPNAAYLIGPDGTVWWRTVWANVEEHLREAVAAAAAGHPPTTQEREPRLRPMLAGTGYMWEVWDAAGGHAKGDVLRQVPPVFLAGRVAALLRPLPPSVRGGVALAVSMAAPLAVVYGARRLARALRFG